MTLWFIRGIRRGVVTTRYPAGPDPSAVHLPTPPVFTADQLTRETADRLVASCPGSALSRDGGMLVYDVGACTACGRCSDAAPRAIRRSGEFELATSIRSALVKKIPVREER